jgi:hypothetical protein
MTHMWNLRATAAQGADSTIYYGSKCIFQATYFETLESYHTLKYQLALDKYTKN